MMLFWYLATEQVREIRYSNGQNVFSDTAGSAYPSQVTTRKITEQLLFSI